MSEEMNIPFKGVALIKRSLDYARDDKVGRNARDDKVECKARDDKVGRNARDDKVECKARDDKVGRNGRHDKK